MKPPDTISSFCAFLFGLMGALFVLLSMLFVVTGVPVNGGPTWFLLPIGIIFLLTGLGFVLKFQQQKRRIKRLKAEGVLTTGEVQSIRHLVWINWNTSTFGKATRTVLPLGGAVLLQISGTNLYCQERPVLGKTVFQASTAGNLF